MRWLVDPAGAHYCRQACRADEHGPCAECPRPRLYEKLGPIWEWFTSALGSLNHAIAGRDGIIMSVPTGIGGADAKAEAEGLGIPLTPWHWRLFRLAESTYLQALADQRAD